MRIIALDVHRSFAQMAILENGVIRDAGKVDLECSRLLHFAKSLQPDDEVVLEATGNTSAIVHLLSPLVARIVISNPNLVRAIAWAKVKTDKIDARAGKAPCERVPARGLDARRGDRSPPPYHGAAHPVGLADDPPQEPDPLGSACSPDPALSRELVLDQADWHDARALHVPETITLLPPASPALNPVKRVWLYLRERYLSHRVLDDYEAVLDAVCCAWNKLLDDAGRLTTLTAYPYLTASGIP